MTEDKVYEVKKTVTLTKHMQLIDLNGLRVNFQSDCVLTTKPTQSFKACIVTQEQLDQGDVRFEDSEHGKYARRVVYQQNTPLNHFAAIRLNGDANDNEEVECSVVVRLRDLPSPPPSSSSLPSPTPSPSSPTHSPSPPSPSSPSPPSSSHPTNAVGKEPTRRVSFADEQEPAEKQALKKQLQALSEEPAYAKPSASSNPRDLDQLLQNDDLTDVQDESIQHVIPTSLRSRPWNIWIWIGLFCFLMCGILWWRQSRRVEQLVPQLE